MLAYPSIYIIINASLSFDFSPTAPCFRGNSPSTHQGPTEHTTLLLLSLPPKEVTTEIESTGDMTQVSTEWAQAPAPSPSRHPNCTPSLQPSPQVPASKSLYSHHVGNAPGIGRVQHDNLSGDVAFHRLRHLIHCAVDGRVIDLEPIVCIPPNEEPDVLLPKETLLIHLHTEEEGWGAVQGQGLVLFY